MIKFRNVTLVETDTYGRITTNILVTPSLPQTPVRNNLVFATLIHTIYALQSLLQELLRNFSRLGMVLL